MRKPGESATKQFSCGLATDGLHHRSDGPLPMRAVVYDHGRPQGGCKTGICPPLEIGTKD